MMRKLIVALAAIALLLPACNRTASGPQRYVIDVDAKSTPKEKFQFSAYFPAEIRVSGGDTIRFRNRSTEAPHTVTFGVLADRSNQPELVTESGENPVVVMPCDIDDEPTAKMSKCDGERLKPYDGSGYWNSGFLNPSTAPKSAGAKNVAVRLAEDIPAGNYTYLCILHPLMSGAITVVEDEGDRSEISDVRAAMKEDAAAERKKAEGLDEPEVEIDGDEETVAAGWGDKVTSVNRFGPATTEIDAGSTVHWKVDSPYEPHTVTFESAFEGLPPEAFVPGGVESGEDYTGGFAHSGLIASGGPFEGDYSLRFPQAGTYEYSCVLHPGMDGTIEVT